MNKFHIEVTKAKLAGLIADGIAGLHEEGPVERGGVMWMPVDQGVLAAHLGVSTKTVHRWTGKPPFQREAAIVGGNVKCTLLRVVDAGQEPVRTPQHVANIMRKIWAEKVGKELSRQQHGCLIGLAGAWPEGSQLAIFKCVLNDWPGYMASVKHLMHLTAEFEGKTLTSEKGNDPYLRFYKYPSITVMRKFPDHAVAIYAIALQNNGKTVPPAVNAIYQKLDWA